MEKTMENNIQVLDDESLRQTSGGSFAFDAGRAIRFMGIYLGYDVSVAGYMATLDFIINKTINEG